MNYSQRYILAVALKNAPSETSGGATGDYGDATTPADVPGANSKDPGFTKAQTVAFSAAWGLAGFVAGGLLVALTTTRD
jgi:hypothetical protein